MRPPSSTSVKLLHCDENIVFAGADYAGAEERYEIMS